MHKKVEDNVAKADREYVLNVLNYDMTDIFSHMGIDTSGGKFCFPEKKDVDANTKMSILTQLRNTFCLPVDDDYLYEEFGIEKPKDYDLQKQRQEEDRKVRQQALLQPKKEEEEGTKEEQTSSSKPQSSKLKDHLRAFFAKAPRRGARLDW